MFSVERIASQSMRDTATYACQDPIHNPISYNLMSQFVWPISATVFSLRRMKPERLTELSSIHVCCLQHFPLNGLGRRSRAEKARTNVWAVERCKKSRALQHEDNLVFFCVCWVPLHGDSSMDYVSILVQFYFWCTLSILGCCHCINSLNLPICN